MAHSPKKIFTDLYSDRNAQGWSKYAADYWTTHALKVIYGSYGDVVSVNAKNKDLLKFGRNENVGTSETCLAHMVGSELHETYVSSNIINSIISSDNGDDQEVKIEGHTVDGNGDFTFVVQTATLNGQTAVTLGTALARVTRCYNNDSSVMAGDIYITETDTYSVGVPDTDAKVHLKILAGQQQSEKAETTISKDDYWIVTGFYGDLLNKTAAFAEVDLQIRNKGKVHRTVIDIGVSDGSRGEHEFKPYLIVPSNSDIRLVSVASASSTDVSGGIQGILASKMA